METPARRWRGKPDHFYYGDYGCYLERARSKFEIIVSRLKLAQLRIGEYLSDPAGDVFVSPGITMELEIKTFIYE